MTADLTEPVGPLHRCMRGTARCPVRCAALGGRVGESVQCGICAHRSSTCREEQPGDGQCLAARKAHGLHTDRGQ